VNKKNIEKIFTVFIYIPVIFYILDFINCLINIRNNISYDYSSLTSGNFYWIQHGILSLLYTFANIISGPIAFLLIFKKVSLQTRMLALSAYPLTYSIYLYWPHIMKFIGAW
jgi:hypothetical protein